MVERHKGLVPDKIVPGENGDAWVEIRGKRYTRARSAPLCLPR
jgi:molecular chaperone DnaK